MTISFVSQVPTDIDSLIQLAFEGQAPESPATADVLARLYSNGEFTGKSGSVATIHSSAGPRVVVAGCGKADACTPDAVRRAVGTAVRVIKKAKGSNVAIALDGGQTEAAMAAAVAEGALLGDWDPDAHITDAEKKQHRLASFRVAGPEDARAGFDRGVILAESQNFARELVNEPANILTPMELAARARAMAEESGLEYEVLDQERMREIGMGSLLGVAQGSALPPTFTILRYRPSGPSATHLGLVGKGVTFDTGGISIKPADGMEKMKYDMGGAATMIGAMRAIARLKPAVTVTAFLPSVENMCSATAQRPGDIVKTLSGKTVEVLNTDAEGRLILNDALTYAQQQGCTHLVDAATLTGSVVVALGHIRVGAYTNNQEFFERFRAASEAQGERIWQMPMDDDYVELLRSPFADLANIGTRWGGSITAAQFLKAFADPAPWVHLDIAGTAWLDDAKPYMAKGPTGVCVRSVVELAMTLS